MNINNRTIFCKDNLEILRNIDSECVDMIYLDPPFNKKKSFTAPIGTTAKGASFKDIFGKEDFKDEWREEFKVEHKELYDFLEAMQFYANESDVAYIAYMAIRIIECHRILKNSGSLFYHCDDTMQHYIKIMLDIVFGRDNFKNEINWKRSNSHNDGKRFGRITDAILYYAKDEHTFNNVYVQRENSKEYYSYIEKETNKRYRTVPLEHRNGTKEKSLTLNGIQYEPNEGFEWRWTQNTLNERLKINPYIIHIGQNGRLYYKLYEEDDKGLMVYDLWTDIKVDTMSKKERRGFPTQKPISLLERIIKCSTNEGDLVLDPFCGCATAAVAAEKLNRQWVGIDISVKAFELVKQRLKEEVEGFNEDDKQYDVFGSNKPISFQTEPPILSKRSSKPKKFIYVISNPNHKGYKVGIAKNVKQRLNGYQTSDPNRGFKLEFSEKTEFYREIESEIHKKFNANYEWVDSDLKVIIKKIKSLIKEYEK